MNISDECQEIGVCVDWLALESVLEEVTEMIVFAVIVHRIA